MRVANWHILLFSNNCTTHVAVNSPTNKINLPSLLPSFFHPDFCFYYLPQTVLLSLNYSSVEPSASRCLYPLYDPVQFRTNVSKITHQTGCLSFVLLLLFIIFFIILFIYLFIYLFHVQNHPPTGYLSFVLLLLFINFFLLFYLFIYFFIADHTG